MGSYEVSVERAKLALQILMSRQIPLVEIIDW
jgi:hypothetical protein